MTLENAKHPLRQPLGIVRTPGKPRVDGPTLPFTAPTKRFHETPTLHGT